MSTKSLTDRQQSKIVLQIVASIIAVGMAGRAANGQTTNAPPTPAGSGSTTNVTKLENVTVIGKLDQARNQIMPDLGATVYTVSKDQIALQAQGGNAPFNQVLLRAPGVAQDSLGQVHLRGEHANLQYRINDVLLPEGITGFGSELDTRFVDRLRVITGALPAEYGFRTAGVVDIQTRSGAFANGGDVSMYGGSFDTLRPSFEYGGSEGKLNYFINGSYDQNGIGIENPTSSYDPIHDDTKQGKVFSYLSYVLDDTSRVSVMLSASYATFQIPNTPGLPAGTAPGGDPWLPGSFNSSNLNENQNEQNYYAVVAYQKSVDNLNLQIAGYGRYSGVHFTPDQVGDLYFNGVGSDVDRTIYSGGLQADASYAFSDKNTLRAGLMGLFGSAPVNSTTTVFNLDAAGNPVGLPYAIASNTTTDGQFYGAYLQDQWNIVPKVTLNFGLRFDAVTGYIRENQVSPRFSAIYQPTEATTLHVGYARYFTPPPLELVSTASVTQFDGTSNESEVKKNDPVQSERANYYDVGISQKLAPGLQVGLDGYYKTAQSQLDDGFFGQTLILSPFNYAQGRVYGVEFTATYTIGGFSTFANVAWSVAQGKNITSSQFLFASNDLVYIHDHWVYLDHDQEWTGSFGASYTWNQSSGSTRVYLDALYGSGLRTDGGGYEPNDPTSPIPNGATVPSHFTLNLGAEHDFKVGRSQLLKARVDLVNVTDNIYQLRDGSGIGVNASQYGMRIGVFGSLSYVF